jgi:hypothetical protein
MSTLFTAVSVEQQEIVAGGAAIALETLNQFVKREASMITTEANTNGSKTNIDVSKTIAAFTVLNITGNNAQ